MPSVHRFVANNRSALSAAVLSATNVRPSNDIRRVSSVAEGYGRFVVEGPYTGQEDTDIEVEVTSDAIVGPVNVSEPVFSGVGSGSLTVLSVDGGASPETVRFTLANKGEPSDPAILPFFGVTLVSLKPGAAGNTTTITVTRNLTYTDLPFSTLVDLAAGTAQFEGSEWDFGAAAGSGGDIPSAALRMAFEGYPQVHRYWKEWATGDWIYHIDPAPNWDIPRDTKVQEVTGTYTVTVSDGVTTENYTAITVFDFLKEVETRSELIEIEGVVVRDRSPGGMAVTDIPLRTDAHVLPASMTVRSDLAQPLTDIEVTNPAAPTENLSIVYRGQDRWDVTGGVSGELLPATTNALYTDGSVQFRIPRLKAPPAESQEINAQFRPTSRGEDGIPEVCFKPLKLGDKAKSKTITFTYQKKPERDCSCDYLPALGVSDYCLGLSTELEGSGMSADYVNRLTALHQWRETFIKNNTFFGAAEDGVTTITGKLYRIRFRAAAQIYTGWSSSGGWVEAVITKDFVSLAEANLAKDRLGGARVTINNAPSYTIFDTEVTQYTAIRAATSKSGTIFISTTSLRPDSIWVYEVPVFASDNVLLGSGEGYNAISGEISFVDEGLRKFIACLSQVYESSSALSLWDVKWAHFQSDMLSIVPSMRQADFFNPDYLKRYDVACDLVRVEAGIYPKSDASTSSGDGCWHDCVEATHWWVDTSGEYLPMCTNEPYTSAKRNNEGAIISTHEFGLGIAVACPNLLRAGDSIVINLKGSNEVDFTEGDQYILPVIGAGPKTFYGGENGDPTQTWAVIGSVSGKLPDYTLNPASPGNYTAGPVNVRIDAGGIPFEEGDRFSLAIEGGEMRWRLNGGAWTTQPIYEPVALGNGLSLIPVRGLMPSYVTGDLHKFKASARYAPMHLKTPAIGRSFEWIDTNVTVTVDLGSVQPIDALVLAMHTLPAGAAVTINGGDAAANEWAEAMTLRDVMYKPVARTARYLSIVITGAPNASLGWFWAGTSWIPTDGASEVSLARQYGLTRGPGRNPSALYRGRGSGGRIAWDHEQSTWLWPADMPYLYALLDHVAENSLEPFVLVPNVNTPEEAALVQLDVDEVLIREWKHYQHPTTRVYSAELPLRGVLA